MKFTLPICAACIVVNVAMADESKCCYLYKGRDFGGQALEFCIEDGKSQSTYDIDFRNRNAIRSAKCGANVSAQVCPGGYHEAPVAGQKEMKQTCMTVMENVYEEKEVLSIHGEQQYARLRALEHDSIIINYHPWTAKGPDYISMSRDEKQGIIWDKITEDDMTAPASSRDDFLAADENSFYDEWGDELECQNNILNSQGNVGKAVWEDLGGHSYTGIFDGGADTGFVRLSTVIPVDSMPNHPMNPTIQLKFLRNHRDSANTVASYNFMGQDNYDFFDGTLMTGLDQDSAFSEDENFMVFSKLKPATDWIGAVGHSDFAMYDQEGNVVDQPNFPFRLLFEPEADLSFPSGTYTSIFDQLKTIAPNRVLYKVLAQEVPDSPTEHIANIWLETELVTSYWGDQKMYFRRQRMDDDIRYHPEWSGHIEYLLDYDTQDEPAVRPYKLKTRSSCPEAFIFQ